jgi:AAA15 family ATPase/GTPase
MHLEVRSISLQNFRSFKDTVKISDLKRVNVLVGPNKAEKSKVFEALLKSLANDDANSRRSLDDYRFDDAKQNKIVIEIEIELSPSEQLQVVKLLGRSNLFDNLDLKTANFSNTSNIIWKLEIFQNLVSVHSTLQKKNSLFPITMTTTFC